VDISKPTVPAGSLPITDPPLGEGRHPNTIGEKTASKVEVLYPMLTCLHASTNVLMLADGGEGRIVLDPAQHV
jgi:hypothetical protein